MIRAKTENYAHYELPDGSSAARLTGGQLIGPVTQTMEKIKKTVLDSNVSDALSAEILGALLAGAIMSSGGGKAIYEATKKFATESAWLSGIFEKVAEDCKSEEMVKVAKAMTISYHLNEKVADIVTGKAQYAKLNDVLKDIVEARPAFEKMATELIHLKVDQYLNKNHMVHPGYIQAAVKNLDHMFKTASFLNIYAESKKLEEDRKGA
jgi:hypothetical protein